jgi:uncharacterized RDD family membrane protein YckC
MRPPSMASRGSRLLAAIVDSLIFAAIYVVGLMVSSFEILILGIVLFGILQIYLLTSDGQTVGKKVMNIKIVMVNGNTNGGFVPNVLMRSILNSLIAMIPFYSLVDILFIFREDQRCIHDLIAGTKVVKI